MKAERLSDNMEHSDHPRVSIIVQSFNQARNIAILEPRLRLTAADELIVCEDGSVDGSHDEWMRRLRRPNDFLLHSNDIHEIRSYGRAIDYARGEFVCLMQDDDQPPKSGHWLSEALEVFMNYPKLAVLGAWCGFNNYFEEEYNAPWLPPGEGEIAYHDPRTGRPLMFVESVNIGPYLFRKSVYRALGGFDLAFSAPGEPGITFESEFCYRAWLRGYEVALTDIPVKMERASVGYIFPGGTSLWANEERVRNELANKRRIVELYGRDLPAIQQKVKEANSQLARRIGRND
jgi:glycosyltransferase involved in cell wall biosynthesis